MEYVIHLLILICIYLILAQSFNLTFGVGRLFNMAHVAVYAIGAYTTALLSKRLEIDFGSCVVASMLFSGVLALLIGAISLRLQQEYFAIGTLAFSSVISALLINWRSLTFGVLGVPGIPRPLIFGFEFSSNLDFLYLIGIFVTLSLLVLYIFTHNSFTRALRAQAESELVCLSLGQDSRLIRNMSFFVSSAFAGLAGSFFAYYINYIDPSSFSLTEMVFVLTIVVVGRPGSFWGVNLATVFLVLLPEALRFTEIPPSYLGPARQLMYALIQFAVVYINRERIFPVRRRI